MYIMNYSSNIDTALNNNFEDSEYMDVKVIVDEVKSFLFPKKSNEKKLKSLKKQPLTAGTLVSEHLNDDNKNLILKLSILDEFSKYVISVHNNGKTINNNVYDISSNNIDVYNGFYFKRTRNGMKKIVEVSPKCFSKSSNMLVHNIGRIINASDISLYYLRESLGVDLEEYNTANLLEVLTLSRNYFTDDYEILGHLNNIIAKKMITEHPHIKCKKDNDGKVIFQSDNRNDAKIVRRLKDVEQLITIMKQNLNEEAAVITYFDIEKHTEKHLSTVDKFNFQVKRILS